MPNNKQKAKSILITGCSTGIGRTTAMYFSELGCQVFAGVRRETDAASLIEEDRFSNIQLRMLDVTKPEQLNTVIGDLEDQLDSGLDALVKNAGISPSGRLEFVQVDKVRETFDVNCIGPLKLVQAPSFTPIPRLEPGVSNPKSSASPPLDFPENPSFLVSAVRIHVLWRDPDRVV